MKKNQEIASPGALNDRGIATAVCATSRNDRKIEYGEFDVSQDREKFLGGSDIPALLGISKFCSRWELLLQKAGLEERNFSGNRYTEYGHYIEPFVRQHVNLVYDTCFRPTRVVCPPLRLHSDGFDGERVLEIKSTSDISSTLDGYKHYLVQLLKYMEAHGVSEGLLAVYERPENFDRAFHPERLQIFEVHMDEWADLLSYVNREIDRFLEDLAKLKDNPLLSEEDFLPLGGDMVAVANKIVAFEKQLAAMKETEAKLKEAKTQLYRMMLQRNVKSWSSPYGTKITRVDEVPAGSKTVTEFDQAAFQAENPLLFAKYTRAVEKKTNGKAGYVRITMGRAT